MARTLSMNIFFTLSSAAYDLTRHKNGRMISYTNDGVNELGHTNVVAKPSSF